MCNMIHKVLEIVNGKISIATDFQIWEKRKRMRLSLQCRHHDNKEEEDEYGIGLAYFSKRFRFSQWL